MADQIDVLCHVLQTAINKTFGDAKRTASKWEPKPCPAPERRNRWTSQR